MPSALKKPAKNPFVNDHARDSQLSPSISPPFLSIADGRPASSLAPSASPWSTLPLISSVPAARSCPHCVRLCSTALVSSPKVACTTASMSVCAWVAVLPMSSVLEVVVPVAVPANLSAASLTGATMTATWSPSDFAICAAPDSSACSVCAANLPISTSKPEISVPRSREARSSARVTCGLVAAFSLPASVGTTSSRAEVDSVVFSSTLVRALPAAVSTLSLAPNACLRNC